MNNRRAILLDSNIIIYATNAPGSSSAQLLSGCDPYASVVTKIEVLGFRRLNATDRSSLERYFSKITIAPLDTQIDDRAIALRQSRKMSLGNCVIAATALKHGLPLATRNVADFSWVVGLQVIDPDVAVP